jgi:hypothetical protein
MATSAHAQSGMSPAILTALDMARTLPKEGRGGGASGHCGKRALSVKNTRNTPHA